MQLRHSVSLKRSEQNFRRKCIVSLSSPRQLDYLKTNFEKTISISEKRKQYLKFLSRVTEAD